jgi:hypothetical protein
MMDSAAREGRPGNASILARLMDTATKTNPVSVAAAPACSAKSACHPESKGIGTPILPRRGGPKAGARPRRKSLQVVSGIFKVRNSGYRYQLLRPCHSIPRIADEQDGPEVRQIAVSGPFGR